MEVIFLVDIIIVGVGLVGEDAGNIMIQKCLYGLNTQLQNF